MYVVIGYFVGYQPVRKLVAHTVVRSRKIVLGCLVGRLWLGLVECCFTSTETVGLLGTGSQDGHLDFHTGPEL